MTQHTPRPWKAYLVVVNNAPSQWHVGTGEWGAPSVAVCNNETTARLIAAAPELLEALTALTDYIAAYGVPEDAEEKYAYAIAAIAKATQ